MKKLILILPFFCLVLNTFGQTKISQYTRTTNLYGASVPYKPDSALSEFSVYNSAGSYSTRAITYYTLRTMLAASLAGIDTNYLKTTGDTGYGPYTFNGLFQSNHEYNYLVNTDTLIQPGMLHFVGSYRKDSVGTAVGYLMNGIMVKAADTSAGLAYGQGTIARRISLHKTFMDMYWGRSTSSYNKINIADDLMVFYMKGSPTMDFDTTGRTYLYNNLLLQNGALFDNTATDTLEIFENTTKLTGNFNITGTTQIGANVDSCYVAPNSGNGTTISAYTGYNLSMLELFKKSATVQAVMGNKIKSTLYLNASGITLERQNNVTTSSLILADDSTYLSGTSKLFNVGTDYVGNKWDLKVYGNTYCKGALTANGAVTLTSYLSVDGNVYLKDPYADIRSYGAVGDGITDNTAAVQAAINVSLNVFIPNDTFLVGNITTRQGTRIFGTGEGSILKFKSGSTGYMINCSTYSIKLENVNIDGGENVSMKDSTIAGDRMGIFIKDNSGNSTFININVHGFDSAAINMQGTPSLSTYTNPPSFVNVGVYNNYVGINTGAGGLLGSEYTKFNGISCTQNRYGMIVNSGNIVISGSHFDTNGYGFKVTDAFNNAHGSVSSSTFNHNDTAVYISGATNGFSITGCNMWYGIIYVSGSTGVNINGCNFGSIGFRLIGGGTCFMKNNWLANALSLSRSGDKFIISDNVYGATNTYYNGFKDLTSDSLGNYQTGKIGIGYNPSYTYGANALHTYSANLLTGISYGGCLANTTSNVAVMSSSVPAIDAGGTIGLGGNYKAASQTYSGSIFGLIKGGKANATDNNFDGYLGFWTCKTGTIYERGRFTEDGYFYMSAKISRQDSLYTQKESSVVFPAGIITLASGQSGDGVIYVDSAGVRLAKIEFSVQDNGVTFIDDSDHQTYITVSNTNGGGSFNVYDGGTSAIIQNSRAYSVSMRVRFYYATN